MIMARHQKTRVMVFGTFDGVHKGHLDFFRQAKRLVKNSELVVSVATDSNVKKIKGRRPKASQRARVLRLKKIGAADKVVLGAAKDYLSHIKKFRPAIIALGYDQRAYTKNLRGRLAKLGLKTKIVRLKAHKPHIYKSSLIS
jgi:FAD synthetase